MWKKMHFINNNYSANKKGEIRNDRTKLILKQVNFGRGYLGVAINGKTRYVHQLVLKAFIENTENKPHVNHKNGDKKDNRLCNLEWCTSKENINHAIKIGLRSYVRTNGIVISPNAKITEKQAMKIFKLCQSGTPRKVISEMCGLSVDHISGIHTKRHWSHIHK